MMLQSDQYQSIVVFAMIFLPKLPFIGNRSQLSELFRNIFEIIKLVKISFAGHQKCKREQEKGFCISAKFCHWWQLPFCLAVGRTDPRQFCHGHYLLGGGLNSLPMSARETLCLL